MLYGYLIAATVMTLGVSQGHSSIASFFSILTGASLGASAIAELLVVMRMSLYKLLRWFDPEPVPELKHRPRPL